MNQTGVIPQSVWKVADRILPGTSIWNFDWDVCCILDGCRVDTFRKFYPRAGAYFSVGSTSKQWISRTFVGDLSEVALITGNPFTTDLSDSEFAYLHREPVQDTVYGVETVPPSVLVDRAAQVYKDRDDIERLVIHFMQPHVPFRSEHQWFDQFRGTGIWGSSVWTRVVSGDIDRETWFRAYRDNLKWVLDSGVSPLLDMVDGTVALTADHGNAAGEWGVVGHPKNTVVPSVRLVPWQTLTGVQRTDPSSVDTVGTYDQDAQLAALGYR